MTQDHEQNSQDNESEETVPLNDLSSTEKSPVKPSVEEPLLQEKSGWRRYAGLTFGLLSSLFFSLTVVLAKFLQHSHGHHPFVISMYRYSGIMIPSIPIAIYFQLWTGVEVFETLKYPLSKVDRWKNLFLYLMQGILGCSAIIFRFVSIQYISIGDSTVVFSAATVLVTILAHFFLNERCGVVSVALAFVTGIGVVIIARPPIITGESEFNLTFLTGTMYASFALLCTAHFLILMRKIRKTHFALMMLVGGVWGVFQSGTLALLLGVFTFPQSPAELGWMIALASLTFLGQTCIVLAIKYENAGPLSIARTSETVYAFFWQYLFFEIVPDYISVIGGGLVITAVLLTGYSKYLSSLATDDPLRRKLNFLLS